MPDFEEVTIKSQPELKAVDEEAPLAEGAEAPAELPVVVADPVEPTDYRSWKKAQRKEGKAFVVLQLLMGSVLLALGMRLVAMQAGCAINVRALNDHGQMAMATVTGKHMDECGQKFITTFVDPQNVKHIVDRCAFTKAELDETPVGAEFEVQYLPEDPSVTGWPDKAPNSEFLAWTAIAGIFMALFGTTLVGTGLLAINRTERIAKMHGIFTRALQSSFAITLVALGIRGLFWFKTGFWVLTLLPIGVGIFWLYKLIKRKE